MGLSLNMEKLQREVPTADYDAVVVGAGPYGLSAVTHLRAQGLKVAVFGKPLQFWQEHMPEGMLLRSYWWATNLSDPGKKYGFEQYFQAEDQHPYHPFSRDDFIRYALWYQTHTVPDVDETFVATIERTGERSFEIRLVDGRVVRSRAVVMAPGLAYYVYRPAEYAHLPAELVSHAADHASFDHFAGKRVILIGGGQSALETAALLREGHAHVQVVSRRPVVWLTGDAVENRSLYQRFRHPKAGISPGWFNWGLEHFPYVFQRLPRSTRDKLLRGRGRYGPAGADWLKDRILNKVPLYELQEVQQIKEIDGHVALTLSSDELLEADHVILCTGYRADVKRLPMLHQSLLSEIRTYHDAPILNANFESSIPGLHFLGFTAVSSCGPLYRFVVGTDAAARRLSYALGRQFARSGRR